CAKCELNIFIYKSFTNAHGNCIKKTIVVKLITIIVYSATHVNVLICIMTGQGDICLLRSKFSLYTQIVGWQFVMCFFTGSILIWTHTYDEMPWSLIKKKKGSQQETNATLINKLNYKPNNINNLFLFYKKIQHIYERDIFSSKKYIRPSTTSLSPFNLVVSSVGTYLNTTRGHI
ncbi:hypothetical protein ACJX0J_021160, partial [Zea mays]